MMSGKAHWPVLTALLAAGCASRTPPGHFPAGAAASPEAKAAPEVPLTHALSELPLPGEPGAEIFEDAQQPDAAQHGHHHGHHHH